MTITYGSVCSGIEAASVAVHPFGWKAVWLAEIEPFPSAVLAHHYPDVPNLGDMTKIADRIRTGEVAAPDVLVGGTPCQAYSVAGLRAGMSDPRGALTMSFVELSDEIDAARSIRGLAPCVIWWENVPGVLSSKDNAFGCFLAGLAGEDCELQPPGGKWPNAGCVVGPKRTVAWRVFDAQYFGVAQRRRRVFVVASARKDFDPVSILFEFEGVRRDSAPSREAGESTSHPIAGCLTSSRLQRIGDPTGQDPVVAVVSAGETETLLVQSIAGALQASGKAAGSATQQDAENGMLVPLSVALRGREGGATAELGDEVAGCLRASGGGGDKAHVLAPIAFDCKASGQSGFGVGEIASTMRSMNSATSHANGGGHLAVCVTGEISHTLKADGFDASEDGTGRGQPIVAAFMENQRGEVRVSEATDALTRGGGKPGQGYAAAMVGMAVRRLTPRECERLQSFPDDYTQIPFRSRKKIEASTLLYLRLTHPELSMDEARQLAADGPRYKALGNSMCVFNMRWIGRRIDAALRKNQIVRAA